MKIVIHRDETVATKKFSNIVFAKHSTIYEAADTPLQPSNYKSTPPNPIKITNPQTNLNFYNFKNIDTGYLCKIETIGNRETTIVGIHKNKNSGILFY